MEGKFLNTLLGKIGEPFGLAERKSAAAREIDARETHELAKLFKSSPEDVNSMEDLITRAVQHVDVASKPADNVAQMFPATTEGQPPVSDGQYYREAA